MTVQELLDLMRNMGGKQPRKDKKVGLYLELKDIKDQYIKTGYNLIELAYDILVQNELSTVADCEDDIPIIIECQFYKPTTQWV